MQTLTNAGSVLGTGAAWGQVPALPQVEGPNSACWLGGPEIQETSGKWPSLSLTFLFLTGRSLRLPPDRPPPRSAGAPQRQQPQRRTWLGGVSWLWEEKGSEGGQAWAIQTVPCFQASRGGQVAKSQSVA